MGNGRNMTRNIRYEPIVWDIETTGLNPIPSFSASEPDPEIGAYALAHADNWRDAENSDELNVQTEVVAGPYEYQVVNEMQATVTGFVNDAVTPPEEGEDVQPFFVGYNSRKFDHQYVCARAGRYRRSVEPLASDAKRLDMMRVAGDVGELSQRPSQDDLEEALGVDMDDPYDGADMPRAIEERNWRKVETHVEADVRGLFMCFYELREEAMAEFYDHYDIDRTAHFGGTIDMEDL